MTDAAPEGPHEQPVRPVRVQLRRTKGWRMPPNTVSVARPGKWGNPFRVGIDGDAERCVWKFRRWHGYLIDAPPRGVCSVPPPRSYGELRGKNLACWCPLDAPCHADVLLELANAGEPS